MSGVDCVLNFGYGYEYMGDDYELDGSNAALGLKAFYTQHLTFGYEHVDGIRIPYIIRYPVMSVSFGFLPLTKSET